RSAHAGLDALRTHPLSYTLARESVLGSGLDPHTPAFDLQRACGTSLETVINIGYKIALGQIDAGIAGGVDSTSDVPVVFGDDFREILLAANRAKTFAEKARLLMRFRPKHLRPNFPGVVEPRTGLS